VRISAGLATGRDSLFVSDADDVAPQLIDEGWAYPTVSGKQLRTHDGPYTNDLILCPYDERGNLVPEDKLGGYGDWAELTEIHSRKGRVYRNATGHGMIGTMPHQCQKCCDQKSCAKTSARNQSSGLNQKDL